VKKLSQVISLLPPIQVTWAADKDCVNLRGTDVTVGLSIGMRVAISALSAISILRRAGTFTLPSILRGEVAVEVSVETLPDPATSPDAYVSARI
jgi:hypothetical protein